MKKSLAVKEDEVAETEHTALEHAHHRSLVNNLKAYLHACVANEMVGRGLSILLSYRRRNKENKEKVNLNDIELYTILMTHYAKKGNFKKILEIYTVIKEDKIKWTPQAYAVIFECLGRMSAGSENSRSLRKFEYQAKQNVNCLNSFYIY